MEFVSLPLVQNFNTLYTDVLNCDIVPPPFYIGRVPQSFVFKKRGAFAAVDGVEVFDTIYDIYEEGTDTYYIGKISTNVLVKKNSTTLYTGAYVAGVQYKFFHTQGPKGTVVESGTGASGVIVGADSVIQDSTKAWTVNYAGKYVYIYEATTGQGQVFKIDSNTGTDLVITNTGWKVPPVAAKYKIFDSYGPTLSFIAGDYIYNIQDVTSVLPVKSIPAPKDVVFFEQQYFILAQDHNVHISRSGFYSAYFGSDSNPGSDIDALNIVNFKNYILLIGNKGINTIHISTRQDITTGAIIYMYTIQPVTTEFGMFTQGSYVIYNAGLYMLSRNKKFIGIQITDVGVDKYTVSTQNQGIYIQQFLDTISDTDIVNIGIDDTNIYIVVKSSGKSTIYNYDIMYTGWHRWDTLLPINNYKLNKFIGGTLYIKGYSAGTDEGNLAYNQNIRTVVGEDNIYNMKRAIITKLYIGKNSTKNVLVKYTAMAGGNVDKYEKRFEESGYIQDVLGYGLQTNGTLGSQLMGISLLGESSTNGLDLISDFALIENPTGFFYEICILDIKGDDNDEFEFGGMILGYEKYEPTVTSYRNVI